MTRTRLLAGLGCLGLITGCSLLPPRPVPDTPPPPQAARPVQSNQWPRPVATQGFVLGPGTGDVIGYLQKTTVGEEDTLSDIARRFDVGYEELVLANPGVDPWLPGVGTEVIVPSQFVLPAVPRSGVVVNIAAMRIFYFPPHKTTEPQLVYTWPIGIGRVGWKTPEGTTRITARQKDPYWIVPKSVRDEHARDGEKLPDKVPPGPNNPLGQYLFRLGWPSYLIHGTNKPYGVGMRSSHGCMRLYPEDIAVAFNLIPVGTGVTVVNQPYLFGVRQGTLYLQAYAVLEDDARDWTTNRKGLLNAMLSTSSRAAAEGRIRASEHPVDWQKISSLARRPRAVPVPVSVDQPGLDAVLGQAQHVANVLPSGSNWDGKGGLLIDEGAFREMLNGRTAAPQFSPAGVARTAR